MKVLDYSVFQVVNNFNRKRNTHLRHLSLLNTYTTVSNVKNAGACFKVSVHLELSYNGIT